VRTSQTELTRIGCYTGDVDGVMSSATRSALSRYLSAKGLPTNDLTVNNTLVATLQKQQPITCLRTCPSGQALKGRHLCGGEARHAGVGSAGPNATIRGQSRRRNGSRPTNPPAAPRATQQAAASEQ